MLFLLLLVRLNGWITHGSGLWNWRVMREHYAGFMAADVR